MLTAIFSFFYRYSYRKFQICNVISLVCAIASFYLEQNLSLVILLSSFANIIACSVKSIHNSLCILLTCCVLIILSIVNNLSIILAICIPNIIRYQQITGKSSMLLTSTSISLLIGLVNIFYVKKKLML